MQAYEGYFENGKFYTAGQTIRIPERKRIFLTILEEPPTKLTNEKNVNDNKQFWTEFDRLVDESADENDILFNDCFKRSTIMREPIDLSDERD